MIGYSLAQKPDGAASTVRFSGRTRFQGLTRDIALAVAWSGSDGFEGNRMPRLKSLPPLLRREKPRLRMDDAEQERDRRRYQEQPWRKWYQSKEWLSLRRQAFERDGYICQRSGELCTGTGNEPNTAVANHKIPHHGDRALFFSLDNIETITKRIHDSLVQREEKRTG